MSNVITVENLGKRYTLHHQQREQYTALRDVITNSIASLGNRLLQPFKSSSLSSIPESEDFWALKDVSFEVKPGDRIGIIGRNGAGKSTLLKILSRITEPSTGSVRIKGRVASLLEVGTGFHPELTGRENIFLNGAILGMGRAEIKKKFDEIVDFAEIEKFLDTPVKRYSSGMYVRLAFAVAAHLEPDILVVDEVLAVGDAQFQKKCLGKMEDVSAREGRTVLFVSHNMGAITQLCNTGTVFEKGKVDFFGPAKAAVKRYVSNTAVNANTMEKSFSGTLADTITIHNIEINGVNNNQVLINSADHIEIVVEGHSARHITNFVFSFSIFKDDTRLFTQQDTVSPEKLFQGDFRVMVTFPGNVLRPGEYTFAFGGREPKSTDWFFGTYLQRLKIEESWSGSNMEINYGIINIGRVKSYRISNGIEIC